MAGIRGCDDRISEGRAQDSTLDVIVRLPRMGASNSSTWGEEYARFNNPYPFNGQSEAGANLDYSQSVRLRICSLAFAMTKNNNHFE